VQQTEVTSELTMDDDRDVAAAAKRAQQKLSTIDVRMEGVTREDGPEDIEDKRREDEERAMQAAEDADSKVRLPSYLGACSVLTHPVAVRGKGG